MLCLVGTNLPTPYSAGSSCWILCRCRGFAEASTARKVEHTVSGRFGTEHVAENGLNHQLVEETTTST